MQKFIEVLANPKMLTDRALAIVTQKMEAAISERGQCTIALSGGGTPEPLYKALAGANLPWNQVQVFWGDERYVPPDHPESNQLMARHAWLDQVNIPEANIHSMPTTSGNPSADADLHEAELRDFFGISPGEFPVFDLILLGIGDDAHTASLFPHTDALQVRDRLITVGNKDGQPRITFTVPLINQSRCVLFLVAGENKQEALTHIFAEDDDPMMYPARLIQPQGELWWLLDSSAGAAIED
ncbi:MAG: 6-phosphogluconolactonase [Cyanobacteriota bacterium]